jgi:hypothetical protein
MNKTYTEPFFIQIKPNNYVIKSDIDGTMVGGKFDWALIDHEQKGDTRESLERVQLMRLWSLQLTSQMAQGKAYTNESDAKVKGLTEEELEIYIGLNNKLVESVVEKIKEGHNTLVVKKTIKSL